MMFVQCVVRVCAVACLVAVPLATSGCTQTREVVVTGSAVQANCENLSVIAEDLLGFIIESLRAGSIGFENAGALMDAVADADVETIEDVGEQTAAGLPPADAQLLREKVDLYGKAMADCRVGLENEKENRVTGE